MNTASATGKSSEAEPSRLRAQVDEALRDHGAILHGLFESAPDAILIMARDGSIARINAQAETMFGYGRGELVGKPLEVLLPRRFRQVHAEHRAAYFSAPRARPMGAGLELYGLRKDGREFPVDITLNPLETDSGIVVLSFIRDITGHERPEEARRESEGHLRALFEHYPDAVLLVDPVSFTIIDCNQAACHMNGYSREELVGQPANMLNEVQVGEEVKAAYVEYLRQEGSLKYEIYHRRKDGTVFPVEVSATCFTLSGQELLLGIDRDITQHKQVEEAEREQRALVEALRDTAAALNSTLHLDEVLDRILANVGRVVPHDSVSIMLIESGVAHIVRRRGYAERGLEASVLAVRFTVADVPSLRQMVDAGQPLAIPDTHAFLGCHVIEFLLLSALRALCGEYDLALSIL